MDDMIEQRLHELVVAHKELKIAMRSHNARNVLRFGEFGVMASIIDSAKEKGKPPVGTGIPMKLLPADRNCTPAMITKLITGLEERGFVRRELATDDRRGVRVSITQKGYDAWESDHQRFKKMFESIGEQMGIDKLMLLFDLTDEFIVCGKQVIEKENDGKENTDEKAAEVS